MANVQSNDSSSSRGNALLRILCLHDGFSTAYELKEQFHLLGEKLLETHSIDLVYVNSPLTVVEAKPTNTPDFTEEEKCHTVPKENSEGILMQRVWWEHVVVERSTTCAGVLSETTGTKHPPPTLDVETNKIDNRNTKTEQPLLPQSNHYLGLDASLMLLRQVWTSCPFWGILAVGQGAAVAALLLAILEHETLLCAQAATNANPDGINNTNMFLQHTTTQMAPSPPQFVIFVSGESLVPVDDPLLMDGSSLHLPILHLVDSKVTPSQERLIRQFPYGSVEHRSARSCCERESSSSTCFDSHDLNILGRYICQRKKELFQTPAAAAATSDVETQDSPPATTSCEQQIMALQFALHSAEQDAADCLAERIAMAPPAALMAVIRPQAVAGWKGNRRRQPNEEGGGAPCPSEFLLQRQQRSAAAGKEAAIRVHLKNPSVHHDEAGET